MDPVPAAHQDGVADARLFAAHDLCASRHEARGQAQIQMRRPGVGQNAVRIKMLQSLVAVFEENRVAPDAEVWARAGHDVTHAFAALPMEVHEAVSKRIPKREVLGIERSDRNGRLIEELAPVDTIRRSKYAEALAVVGITNRLNPLPIRRRTLRPFWMPANPRSILRSAIPTGGRSWNA